MPVLGLPHHSSPQPGRTGRGRHCWQQDQQHKPTKHWPFKHRLPSDNRAARSPVATAALLAPLSSRSASFQRGKNLGGAEPWTSNLQSQGNGCTLLISRGQFCHVLDWHLSVTPAEDWGKQTNKRGPKR